MLIFKISKDSQPYKREKMINYFSTKIKAHTKSSNYTHKLSHRKKKRNTKNTQQSRTKKRKKKEKHTQKFSD